MIGTDNPMETAWRAYRKLLQSEELDAEAMSIAQQSYKDGWAECEHHWGVHLPLLEKLKE